MSRRRLPHHRPVRGRRRAGPRDAARARATRACIAPDEVDYINAHGTSTPAGDQIETLAIKTVFGEHARKLAFSSTKSMTGHLLGAAGGSRAAVSVLTIKDGIIPPTINLTTPRPRVRPRLRAQHRAQGRAGLALTNSFGFGGTNASVLSRKHNP